MKKWLLSVVLLISAFSISAQTSTLQMTVDGIQRQFIVHLPPNFVAGQHLPLVINMHGYTSNATQEEAYTQMDVTADVNHFIVVYPDGIANAWNVGWPGNSGVNDVGFISKVIDTMINLYAIDVNRVYACGLSNGGFMSHKLACDLGERFAAIASVAGTFSDSMVLTCNPTRKIPVMQIHGTADATVPYNGFSGGISVEATINKWLAYNQCTLVSDTILVPNIYTNDNSTVQRINYRDCGDSTEILFLKVIGGGHTWPDASFDIPGLNTNHDINASTEIWNFFSRHTLSQAVGIGEVNTNISNLKVYPNPASNQLKISSATIIQRIELLNLLGETLLVQTPQTTDTAIDVSSYANGIYFLRVEISGEVMIRKVIKE